MSKLFFINLTKITLTTTYSGWYVPPLNKPKSMPSFINIGIQEDYDNCGLQIGNAQNKLGRTLICFDITEEVVNEAIEKNCNLIISHHPLIFKGVKKITGSNYIERIILKAVKSDIAIYCAHTSLDNNYDGLNLFIAEKLGLKNTKILSPRLICALKA